MRIRSKVMFIIWEPEIRTRRITKTVLL